MNIEKIENILKLYNKKENDFDFIDESSIDKIINIMESGRIPKEERILDILEKLDEGGIL